MDNRVIHTVFVPITCVSPVTVIGVNMTDFSSAQSSEAYFKQAPVLIFSKDPDARFLFRTLLGLLGYCSAETDGLADCVHLIDGANPCLMLMDVVYPFQDDLDLLTKKMDIDKLPVVLVSNYPHIKFRELQHKLNVKDHLIKPVSFTVLESCLKKHVRGGQDQVV